MSTALGVVGDLPAIDLTELTQLAELQHRRDRKYAVTATQLEGLLAVVGDRSRVLQIDNRRVFRYESVYFDTPTLDAFRLAAHRRRTRFKVRTRTYLDSGACLLEVKLRDIRGATIKHRVDHAAGRSTLDDSDRQFLGGFPHLAMARDRLQPTLVTEYSRITLLVDDTRVTIDIGVGCRAAAGTARFGQVLILETKSRCLTNDVDVALWRLGVRPIALSKYATGLAALRPDLPRNRWHRTIQRHVDIERSSA